MNNNFIFCSLCFILLCLASSSYQQPHRIARQVLFPDEVTNEDRFGWGNRPNRPNGNRPPVNGNGNGNGNGNRPNGNRPNNQQTTTTTAATPVTPNPQCMLTCLRTPEYNPVCGSNRQDYDNPSNLQCARRCGLSNLTMLRIGRCPPAAAAE